MANPTTTRTTTTTPQPPPLPRVNINCMLNGAVGQRYRMEAGGDFTAAWVAKYVSCEKAIRTPGPLVPIEQQTLITAGYPEADSLGYLYAMCAEVNADEVYISPSHTLSPGQINEVNGMLVLCPNHPQAGQLKDAIARGQPHADQQGRGEIFYAGTFLVGKEIQPGTYAVEGQIENCYWERTNSTGEIIDNNFVTGARRVQVTIASSDYSFHNEGCGEWRKVE